MNESHATKRPTRKTAVIVTGIILAILVTAITLLTASCSTGYETADAGSEDRVDSIAATGDIEEISNREDEAGSAIEIKRTSEAGASEVAANEDTVAAHQSATQQPSNCSSKQESKQSAASSTSAPQKRWVEDTEQIWVEDHAAWSEQIPVYGSKEVSICNVCGEDVTGNASAHGKAHMLAGEGSGHHSEVKQVITGYSTVNHPAEGHYETRVTGGHWE